MSATTNIKVYNEEGLLVANGSVEHFWDGNLKQRNLDGSEWKDRTKDSDSDYSDGDDDDPDVTTY